ncbi:hypothetical protein P350_11420 [Burkholderia cepacia JBK9]|nr:hypothetical protein P350_11420 [Burkholderia cepacia JBK9]
MSDASRVVTLTDEQILDIGYKHFKPGHNIKAEANFVAAVRDVLAAHPGQPEPRYGSVAAFNDEAREFLYGNLDTIRWAIELADATGNCSQARGLEAVEYQIRRLFSGKPEPRAEVTDGDVITACDAHGITLPVEALEAATALVNHFTSRAGDAS